MDSKEDLVNEATPPAYSPPAYNSQYEGNFNTSYTSPLGDSAGFSNPSGYGGVGGPPMTVVTQQPVSYPHQITTEVPDYMGLALFVTLCCCWPLGVVAMRKATESREALQRNDLVNAHLLAQDSRRTSIQGMIIGAILLAVVASITVGVIVYMENLHSYTY